MGLALEQGLLGLHYSHLFHGFCHTSLLFQPTPGRLALDVQAWYRQQLEAEPVRFMETAGLAALVAAVADVAGFVGADWRDVVPVSNATTGVNAVLQSLKLQKGDLILMTNATYAAVSGLKPWAEQHGKPYTQPWRAACVAAQHPIQCTIIPFQGIAACLGHGIGRYTAVVRPTRRVRCTKPPPRARPGHAFFKWPSRGLATYDAQLSLWCAAAAVQVRSTVAHTAAVAGAGVLELNLDLNDLQVTTGARLAGLPMRRWRCMVGRPA